MKKPVAKLAQQIEPPGAGFLGQEQVEIDRVANVAQQNDGIAADEKAGQPVFGSAPQKRRDIFFHSAQIRWMRVAVAAVSRILAV